VQELNVHEALGAIVVVTAKLPLLLSNWKVLLEAGQQDLSTQLDVVLMQ